MNPHNHPQNIPLHALGYFEGVAYSEADHALEASLPNPADSFSWAGS